MRAIGCMRDGVGAIRTNNALLETFTVNAANELTGESDSGTLTVAGTSTGPATSVTVSSSSAARYADNTFAASGFTPVSGNNTCTANASDAYRRNSSGAITCCLPNPVYYTYDANGNLLNDNLRNFAYDDENQLIAVWVPNAWQSTFVYDGKMRRRIRKEYAWQGGAWVETNEVHYIYDGNVVIQERDILNFPQVTYTRGIDLSGALHGAGGIGGLLARTDNHLSTINSPLSTSFYHCDGNGNITCLINSFQSIAARYLYDPFGNILSQAGSLAGVNLYCFSSKEYHPNSGLIYYGYRFYDPNLQRWLNRDPLLEPAFEVLKSGWAGGSLFTAPAEPYEVANNDAVDFVDTDGRGAIKNGLGAVGGAIKNCWKGICGAVAAASGIAGCCHAYNSATAAAYGWGNYNNARNMLNNKIWRPRAVASANSTVYGKLAGSTSAAIRRCRRRLLQEYTRYSSNWPGDEPRPLRSTAK